MTKNQPGYPLPAGELGEDEIVCQLVYLPDRAEYWQALLAAIHYMSTWRAWERDSNKRGKDAASNWREAFELTMGCWRMTCLEQLQSDVANILAYLRNTDPCCDTNITYYDSSTHITVIVPGVGDPPETYGETAVEDWDEWSEYLCHNANLWVDELIRAANTMDSALSTGGLTIGLLAAILTAIAFFVVGGVLALPILMTILFGLTVGVSATVFADAADDLETNRDFIVCALVQGQSVSTAVMAALNSGTAWDTLYQFIDYDSATAILYNGGDGETYLEAETDDTCACDIGLYYELRIDGYGSFSSQDRIQSELVGPCHEMSLLRLYRKADNKHVAMTLVLVGTITNQPCGGENMYICVRHEDEDPPVRIWDATTPPVDLDNVGSLHMIRTNSFTNVNIIWELWEG